MSELDPSLTPHNNVEGGDVPQAILSEEQPDGTHFIDARDVVISSLRLAYATSQAQSARLASENARLKIERAKLREQVGMDDLTHLLTRSAFEERVAARISNLRREEDKQKTNYLAIIDLDHFKQVNDLFGHPIGDEALKRFATRLRATRHDRDVVGRYGGEEFVFFIGQTNLEEAVVTIRRLQRSLREVTYGSLIDDDRSRYYSEALLSTPLTVSVGIAELAVMSDFNLAVEAADQALYNVKHSGRDGIALGADGNTTRLDLPSES